MPLLSSLRHYLEKPVRFDYIGHYLVPGATMLDIGCGSKAPYSTTEYFPGLKFSGVDYADIAGKKDMAHFFKLDLEKSDLKEIPEDTYDIINLSHIIEHISEGEKLLAVLVSKLKSGGIIYIETPSEKSLKLPSWYGTLNFYDDSTHKKIYSLQAIENVLTSHNCTIIRSDIRRNAKRIVLSPLYALASLISTKKLNATVLWDITGFAHYVLAQKN